jgi:hypothetical protein
MREEEVWVAAREHDHGEVLVALDLVHEMRELGGRVGGGGVDRPVVEGDSPLLRREPVDAEVGVVGVGPRGVAIRR